MNDDTTQPVMTDHVLLPLGLVGTDHDVHAGREAEFTFAPLRALFIQPWRLDVAAFNRLDFVIQQITLDGMPQLPAPVLAQHFQDARWMQKYEHAARITVFNQSGARRTFWATLQVKR